MQFASTQYIEQTADHVSRFWPSDTIQWRHGNEREFRKQRKDYSRLEVDPSLAKEIVFRVRSRCIEVLSCLRQASKAIPVRPREKDERKKKKKEKIDEVYIVSKPL